MADAIAALHAALNNDLTQIRSIGQNVANGSTIGYKREMPVTTSFSALLDGQAVITEPEMSVVRDMKQGALKPTGKNTDIAIEGDAFLVADSDGKIVYSRKGELKINEAGYLTLENGALVEGERGKIALYPEPFSISSNGEIHQHDRIIDRLRLVGFENPNQLEYLGNGLFQTSDGFMPADAAHVNVKQGFLEASNVNMTDDMVQLVESSRHFEISHKVLRGYDGMLDAAINVLGQF